jgi:predicted dehydrogenase
MNHKHLSRRTLLATAASAAAFSIVPRHVLGQGQTPPSEKVALAGIGVGGQGHGDINALHEAGAQIVALCDADRRRAADSFAKYPDARQFKDFREMLEKIDKQIDAVLVATPDHTHAVAVADAIKRKKHVYCEKPLAHSIWEVRELMRLAKEHKVVTQLGNQGHSSGDIRRLVEWVQDGAIGKVHTIHAGCNANNTRLPNLPDLTEKHDVPAELDWDLWLGPAAFRPYHPAYLPGKWRGWMPFGTGTIGDWTCHVIDPSFWALDLGAPATIKCDAHDYDPVKHADTFPRGNRLTYTFPAKGARGPVTLHWFDGTNPIPRPEQLEPDRKMVETGAVLFGDKGAIMHGSHGAGGVRIIPETAMREYQPRMPKESIPRVKGHQRDFITAIREGRKAGSDFAYGGPLTEIALLGVIATRCLGEELRWDSQKMRFANSEKANKLIKPVFREGWHL